MSYLSVLVLQRAGEHVGVAEALRARALAHGHHAVLLGVQHAALLAHRLGVRHRRAEVPVPRYTPCKYAMPKLGRTYVIWTRFKNFTRASTYHARTIPTFQVSIGACKLCEFREYVV